MAEDEEDVNESGLVSPVVLLIRFRDGRRPCGFRLGASVAWLELDHPQQTVGGINTEHQGDQTERRIQCSKLAMAW
jgi:hypothetical protein